MAQLLNDVDQLTLAAIALPIIILVVTIAVDSVEKQDYWKYRAVVGGLGLGTILSGFAAVISAVLGEVFGGVSITMFLYLIISIITVFLLVAVVLRKEIFRGMNRDSPNFTKTVKTILKIFTVIFVINLILAIGSLILL